MNRVIFLIFFLLPFYIQAQGPRVPSVIEFGDMKLYLNDAARRQIQTDVDNLRRSEKYFRNRLEKVDIHFPVIEKIFREEKVPEDFKYLVIQESALVSDAVSSSNAVGFWQFKKETGLEMGLRIDRLVDERLNLVSSTRAAARYLKKNNFRFDNWIYALLAYNTGPGGAEKYVKQRDFGKSKMDITGNTHWYVKKFLAHKIAYEDEVGKNKDLPFFLFEYNDGEGKELKHIAKEFEIEKDLLVEYNKCFKKEYVPDDKPYTVLIPIGFDKANLIARKNDQIFNKDKKEQNDHDGGGLFSFKKNSSPIKNYYSEADKFPVIERNNSSKILEVNGKKGTIAEPRDNFDMMAVEGGLSLDKFMKYNDLTPYDEPIAGQVYYFQKKHRKAKTHYHTLLPGQTLWQISQKYGIRLKKLLTKNRLEDESEARAGLVLWLRYIRPRDVPPEYHDVRHFLEDKKEKDQPVQQNSEQNEIITEKTPPITEPDTEDGDIFFEEEDVDVTQETSYEETEEVFIEEDEEKPLSENTIYKETYHTVSKGDTYFSISRLYDVDISDLLEWNNLHINSVLSIGQRLLIRYQEKPVDTVMSEEKIMASNEPGNEIIIHKVKGEETLYGIAKKYQVTIKEIMEWNGKEDFVIKADEELKIYIK